MEINFVTGKGGVGKSAVAAALALKKARQGHRTLLVELGDQSYYRDFFSISSVNYIPTTYKFDQGNFDIAQWSGQDCLKEYAIHILKVESLYRLFFENPVSKALINVAPALAELAILGKLTSGPPRNVGPKLPYDVIVVDAYASGHFMALMNAPAGLAAAVSFGPMGEQVRSIDMVLRDSRICNFYVVALPEELPVVEGLELATNIEKVTGHKSKILLNRVLPFNQELNSELKNNLANQNDFADYLSKLNERQNLLLNRLQQSGRSSQSLPWILTADPRKLVQDLAKELGS